jgi:hypothetical protein
MTSIHRTAWIFESFRHTKYSPLSLFRSVLLYLVVSSWIIYNVNKLLTIPVLKTPVSCSVYSFKFLL